MTFKIALMILVPGACCGMAALVTWMWIHDGYHARWIARRQEKAARKRLMTLLARNRVLDPM